jgi:hypothetical protein
MRCSVILALFLLATAARADDDFKPIFDGKSLKGWKAVFNPKDKDTDAAKTFVVDDGMLKITGFPLGYLRTEEKFDDYIIRYEWRFPKEQPEKTTMNTGLLVHIQSPDEVMPKSVEPQGRLMDHGKIFFIKIKGEHNFDAEAHKKATKPQGEWNVTEVRCAADGTVMVKLNGILVDTGKTELTSGPIGFQCEGAAFHIRKVEVKKLK